MKDNKARLDIQSLNARVLAIRDVVARLVAYESARWPDPDEVLNNFADARIERHAKMNAEKPPSPAVIAFQEEIQREIDWIMASARSMRWPEDEL